MTVHHLSSFKISFDLQHLPQFLFHNNKRLSCLKSAYLLVKIEEDSPLTLEGYKFITGCLAGVVVPSTEVNNVSVVEILKI